MPRRTQERWRPHPAGDGVGDESRDAEFLSSTTAVLGWAGGQARLARLEHCATALRRGHSSSSLARRRRRGRLLSSCPSRLDRPRRNACRHGWDLVYRTLGNSVCWDWPPLPSTKTCKQSAIHSAWESAGAVDFGPPRSPVAAKSTMKPPITGGPPEGTAYVEAS